MFNHSALHHKILHVDDQPCMQQGLRAIVRSARDFQIVDSIMLRDSLISQTGERPDLIVFDFPKGLEEIASLIGSFRKMCATAYLVALTSHDELHIARYVFQLGVNGYILKRAAPLDVLYALRKVVTGGTFVDPAIASGLLLPDLPGSTSTHLSNREMNVMKLVARGYSNKEISGQLDLSVKTIETYRCRAVEKLGLRSRAAIVKFASSAGWLDEYLN
jgi:DNA-binding NarL/FixJ family response regulator